MKEIAAVLLAFLSFASYFVLATSFGVYQRWPVVHILVLLAACFWLVRLMVRAKSVGRRIYGAAALLLSLGLTGLFVWYTLDYSTYESTEATVAVGESLADRLDGWRLASHTGEETAVLRPAEDRGTLLVFYRGHW